MDLETLLNHYFPKELPPTFTTERFASIMQKRKPTIFDIKDKSGNLLKHEIPRHGLNRRIMGIPNPIFHLQLCNEIIANWNTIEAIYNKSEISRSSPLFFETDSEEDSDIDPLLDKLNTRASAAYILKADISRCFASIYTHSIPWAIHGKEVAKDNRDDKSLLGNKLDELIRKGQDDQTIGIPIGPYTSVVISEIILCIIDAILKEKTQARIGSLRGTRYVDDFEFGFKTYSDAEACLVELNFILASYELEINQLKTEIIKLPAQLEAKWVQQLRNFRLKNQKDVNAQRRGLLAYFDEVYTLLEADSQEHILNYALSKLSKLTIFPDNHKILQDFLFQCLMINSSTFLRVLSLLQEIHNTDISLGSKVFDHQTFKEILHHLLNHNCKLKRGHEVAWVLWAMMYWGYYIGDKEAEQLSEMDDSIVALMSLHARSLNLIMEELDTSLWESYMNEAGLYGPQWLLAYEANMKGWLPKTGNKNYVQEDVNFRFFKNLNIKFYDLKRLKDFDLKKLLERNIVRGGMYGSPDDDEDQSVNSSKA